MYGRRWLMRGVAATGAWLVATRIGVAGAAAPARLSVVPTNAERGEDGNGRRRQAANPHALVLEAEAGWPARALDPVLHIGALHFHSYEHTGRRTLRFVIDDVSRLTAGAEVYVQYGDDAGSRVRLPQLEKSW